LSNIKIIKNQVNEPLNHIWNKFVDGCKTEFVCLLNNDIKISPNFLSSTIEVFDLEPEVGAVNHSTNHPNYTKWSDELEYKVIDRMIKHEYIFTNKNKN
jgi:GT2 family glycosyltransferase